MKEMHGVGVDSIAKNIATNIEYINLCNVSA